MRVSKIKWKRSAIITDRRDALKMIGPCELALGKANGEPATDAMRCTYWVVVYEDGLF